MNTNWTVKLNTFKPVENSRSVEFDQKALAAHKANGNKNREISQMIQGLDWDKSIGDVANTSEVPEFGSEEAVQGAQDNMLNDDKSIDFSLNLDKFVPTENDKVAFDQNALENHRQNGFKGTIKGMLSNMIGGAMAV